MLGLNSWDQLCRKGPRSPGRQQAELPTMFEGELTRSWSVKGRKGLFTVLGPPAWERH